MVDREHPKLPIVRQCALLGVSRSSLYYRPKEASEEDLFLMGEIDRQYLETPFYGSRRMRSWLGNVKLPSMLLGVTGPSDLVSRSRCPGIVMVPPRPWRLFPFSETT